MLPDRVSNPGPLTYESDALPIALRGPSLDFSHFLQNIDLLMSTESKNSFENIHVSVWHYAHFIKILNGVSKIYFWYWFKMDLANVTLVLVINDVRKLYFAFGFS